LNNQYLTIWDLVLTPIYLGILILIAKRYRDKHYPVGNPLRKYYLPGLYAKFFGVIFIAVIYQYYYGGGDTFNYYSFSRVINSSLDDSFTTWAKLILRMSPDSDPKLYPYASQIEFYTDPASYSVIRLSAILGLLNFTTYIPIALLFAHLSYTGIWAMYRTFVKIYPNLIRPLAMAFLFIPSTFVWGSAIFKDTVCMFGLGWMVYTSFRIFIDRDFSLKNFFLLGISFYLIAVIKIYILLAFLPALALWILMTFSHQIRIASVRFLVRLLVIGVVIGAFVLISRSFSKELNRYSLDKITSTIESTRGWIVYASGEEGSAYDLGTVDASLGGMLSKFPAAVNVTLFRPFLWEVKKPIMLLSALESMMFFILLLIVFYRNGVLKTFVTIFKNPNLLFFFAFTLIFAFAIGISTGNFGTLSRYKIPCMPFFAAFLIVLLYKDQSTKNIKKRVVGRGQLAMEQRHQY
jgi:hypothetical protein